MVLSGSGEEEELHPSVIAFDQVNCRHFFGVIISNLIVFSPTAAARALPRLPRGLESHWWAGARAGPRGPKALADPATLFGDCADVPQAGSQGWALDGWMVEEVVRSLLSLTFAQVLPFLFDAQVNASFGITVRKSFTIVCVLVLTPFSIIYCNRTCDKTMKTDRSAIT